MMTPQRIIGETQGRKPSWPRIGAAACLVAVFLTCNGCFIIAGTGNVRTGIIEQTGTKEAWQAAGEAVGIAGGTAGKIMTRP